MDKRFKRKKQQRNAKIEAIFRRLQEGGCSMEPNLKEEYEVSMINENENQNMEDSLINFDDLPESLDPCSGHLEQKEARVKRKQQQLLSLLKRVLHELPFLQQQAQHQDTVAGSERKVEQQRLRAVEFGAGTGHAGLLLAWLRPDVEVVLVERKAYTAGAARRRAAAAGLANVAVFEGGAEELLEHYNHWDIGFGLHCCGSLTDLSQKMCVEVGATYVIVPCCYGQVSKNGCRSQCFFEHLDCNDFSTIASAADFSVAADDEDFPTSEQFQVAKKCMMIVDADRNSWAAEAAGYSTSLESLFPLSCSPKNNLIVGVLKKHQGDDSYKNL